MIRYQVPPGVARVEARGGVRGLFDHVAILHAHGFPVMTDHIWGGDLSAPWRSSDLAVVPECWAVSMVDNIPHDVRVVALVQNGYYIDGNNPHITCPYETLDNLAAVVVESEHSAQLVRLRAPKMRAPLYRFHPCANIRHGAGGLKDGPFHFGAWPRRRVVMFFDYKHGATLPAILEDLELPEGWRLEQLAGMSDEQVADALATGAVFLAPNTTEGLCAPTAEAQLSGAVIVGWPGGPSIYHGTPQWAWSIDPEQRRLEGGPMEYLTDRAVIVQQDNVSHLRWAVLETCRQIDTNPWHWGRRTAEWAHHQEVTYSRQREERELVEIFEQLHPR